MSSAKWRQVCLGLNMLTQCGVVSSSVKVIATFSAKPLKMLAKDNPIANVVWKMLVIFFSGLNVLE